MPSTTDRPSSLADLQQRLLGCVQEAALALHPDAGELPPLEIGFPQKAEMGDLSLKLFAWAKPLRTNPARLSGALSEALRERASAWLEEVRPAGPYINLVVRPALWFELAVRPALERGNDFGCSDERAGQTILVEYASPNTNKPLHLGHVRNVLLGHSVSQLLGATGARIIRANLVNDRGIHICKSMLAYQLQGGGETPASTDTKGDHFVGRYYVAFAQLEKADEEAGSTEHLDRAREMLLAWEAEDPEVRALWRQMNDWVLDGFHQTFERLGVGFERIDFESQTYRLGKDVVEDGIARGVFVEEDDGSVWLDLTDIGMDRKIFRRSDGTSVYITQDLGTALARQQADSADGITYVVGNEQDYHFRVLFEALRRLGHAWADGLHHLSYGMVELPGGKLKSREGTRVDADDLMDEVLQRERQLLAEREKDEVALPAETLEQIALGALKFYVLKFSPRKNFVFDPAESVKLQGDTGPYVQYVHTRVASILRTAVERGMALDEGDLGALGNAEERALARLLLAYPGVVSDAARDQNPAIVCAYLLELSRSFSRWYHDHSVLGADDPALVGARVSLARAVATAIRNGLRLLGISAPEAM